MAVISRLTRAASLLVIALAVTTMSACAPEPQPSPTPTPAFASEEEAFAAAEEVYRAYIDAFNAVDLQDPKTFEPPAEFTAGEYQSSERETLSEMHANGYHRSGAIKVLWFKPLAVTDGGTVEARTCDDVSGTTFTDASGQSLVPSDRPAVYALDLRFEVTEGELLLLSAEPVEDGECAV